MFIAQVSARSSLARLVAGAMLVVLCLGVIPSGVSSIAALDGLSFGVVDAGDPGPPTDLLAIVPGHQFALDDLLTPTAPSHATCRRTLSAPRDVLSVAPKRPPPVSRLS